MNIWLFNPFDMLPWEGKPQRYATLATCLAERGHSVVHWSSGFSHSFKKRREVPDDFDLEALPYAIELIDCPSYSSNVGLRRLLNHRQYGKGLFKQAMEAVASGRRETPDLILSSMPPIEGPSAALSLKKSFGCKMVLDVMDAWPDTLLQAFPNGLQSFGKVLLLPYRRQLRIAFQGADGISAQSKTFARMAGSYGAKEKPTHVCILGADPAPPDFCPRTPNKLLRLLYLGAMGLSYDLATLFGAVERLNRHTPTVRLDVVGEGEKRAALEARQLPHVRFFGYLSGEQLEARLHQADVGIVPFLPGSGVAIPYKAGEYLAYALPLISSIDGELGDLVRLYSCGSIYTAGQASCLTSVLQTYLDDAQRLADEKGAALKCFDAHFNRKKIYPEFAKWLETVAS